MNRSVLRTIEVRRTYFFIHLSDDITMQKHFLLQALLSSEPKSSSCSLLKMTMKELIALAMPPADRDTDCSTVPQVQSTSISLHQFHILPVSPGGACLFTDLSNFRFLLGLGLGLILNMLKQTLTFILLVL